MSAPGPVGDDHVEHHRDERWPQRLYALGEEPDPRFSLANERTLLAWLRTSLALVVAGIAAVGLGEYISPPWLGDAVAAIAFASGGAGAVAGLAHWWRVEAALRTRRPLPSGGAAMGVGVVVAGFAVVGVVALVAR